MHIPSYTHYLRQHDSSTRSNGDPAVHVSRRNADRAHWNHSFCTAAYNRKCSGAASVGSRAPSALARSTCALAIWKGTKVGGKEKTWENHEKTMRKPWENHEKTVRKQALELTSWERREELHGLFATEVSRFPGKINKLDYRFWSVIIQLQKWLWAPGQAAWSQSQCPRDPCQTPGWCNLGTHGWPNPTGQILLVKEWNQVLSWILAAVN